MPSRPQEREPFSRPCSSWWQAGGQSPKSLKSKGSSSHGRTLHHGARGGLGPIWHIAPARSQRRTDTKRCEASGSVTTNQLAAALLLLFVLCPARTFAQEAPPAPAPAPPAPYSLPWQLRSVMASTSLRSDTSLASYEDASAAHGLTVATNLSASFRVPGTSSGTRGTGLAPLVRFAFVGDSPPSGAGGTAIVNPLLGVTYAF